MINIKSKQNMIKSPPLNIKKTFCFNKTSLRFKFYMQWLATVKHEPKYSLIYDNKKFNLCTVILIKSKPTDQKLKKITPSRFVNGTSFKKIDDVIFKECDGVNKEFKRDFIISKKSINLKPALQKLTDDKEDFRLDDNPENPHKTWKVTVFRSLPQRAYLRIINNKRNIFSTLSNLKEEVLSAITSGLVKHGKKNVKGREKQSDHTVKSTGVLVQQAIIKHNVTSLILSHTGDAYNKKRNLFLNYIKGLNPLTIYKMYWPVSRSHNGCRPPKIRRK